MAQNHGSRARLLANVPLPNGPWAPFVAIAAVLATVALVAGGPRIGGESPTVPDGRAYTTADSAPVDGIDRTAPDDPVDGPPVGDREPANPPTATPRPRRRTPAASHRKRRATPARPRTRATHGVRRPVPAPVSAPVRPPKPAARGHEQPAVRPASTPHRAPSSSAEREFGL